MSEFSSSHMTDFIVPSITGNVTGLLAVHFTCCGVLGLVSLASSSVHYQELSPITSITTNCC